MMSFRTLARLNAVTSLAFGLIGLVLPSALASALGLDLGGLAVPVALGRLAATAYLGYAVLAWMSRDVIDPLATRAIAAGNAVAWGLGAAVAGAGLITGLGEPRAWAVVVMQVAFATAWSLTLARTPIAVRTA
jgi:hypothetical protein